MSITTKDRNMLKITDKLGWEFVRYINNPCKTALRFIFQLIRGNIRIKYEDKK